MRPVFDVDIVKRNGELTVVVSGEIDLATGTELDAALTRAEATDARTIIVDLERVTFMDASGLGVLVRHASLEGNADRLRITPGPPQVQRLFDLSGLRAYLPFSSVR